MKKKQNEFLPLLVIGVIAVGIALADLMYIKRGDTTGTSTTDPYQQQYREASNSVTPVEDTSGLNGAIDDLDKTNVSEVDTMLNQLNSDTSSFY